MHSTPQHGCDTVLHILRYSVTPMYCTSCGETATCDRSIPEAQWLPQRKSGADMQASFSAVFPFSGRAASHPLGGMLLLQEMSR